MDLAYTTLTQLAKLSEVSETTVVRFVSKLGYKGFPEFKDGLRDYIETSTAKKAKLRRFDIQDGNYEFPRDICKAIFALEAQVMQNTLTKMDMSDHEKAVNMLYEAPDVYVVGCGANTCCSQAMGFVLQVIRPNVHIIEHLDLPERSIIRSARKGSVAVVFTTPRYPSLTQKIANMLNNQGIAIIGVSDSLLSPIVPYCKIFFQIPEKYVAFTDTNAAYMALIHSFAFALNYKDKKKARAMIADYNDFVQNYDYYEHGDFELVELDYDKL